MGCRSFLGGFDGDSWVHDLEPMEYRYTQGVRKMPANTSLIPATWMGVNTVSPRFMRMKELPQIHPKIMIKNRGNHLNFTSTKVRELGIGILPCVRVVYFPC